MSKVKMSKGKNGEKQIVEKQNVEDKKWRKEKNERRTIENVVEQVSINWRSIPGICFIVNFCYLNSLSVSVLTKEHFFSKWFFELSSLLR
jgi:hypothetical protein